MSRFFRLHCSMNNWTESLELTQQNCNEILTSKYQNERSMRLIELLQSTERNQEWFRNEEALIMEMFHSKEVLRSSRTFTMVSFMSAALVCRWHAVTSYSRYCVCFIFMDMSCTGSNVLLLSIIKVLIKLL